MAELNSVPEKTEVIIFHRDHKRVNVDRFQYFGIWHDNLCFQGGKGAS